MKSHKHFTLQVGDDILLSLPHAYAISIRGSSISANVVYGMVSAYNHPIDASALKITGIHAGKSSVVVFKKICLGYIRCATWKFFIVEQEQVVALRLVEKK